MKFKSEKNPHFVSHAEMKLANTFWQQHMSTLSINITLLYIHLLTEIAVQETIDMDVVHLCSMSHCLFYGMGFTIMRLMFHKLVGT